MKPSMSFVDERDEEKKDEIIPTEAPPPSKKQLIVKMQAREHMGEYRPTMQQLKDAAEKEQWLPLAAHAADSGPSLRVKEKLTFAPSFDESDEREKEIVFDVDEETYLDELSARDANHTLSLASSTASSSSSMTPLEKRIHTIMHRAQIASFRQISERCNITTPDDVSEALRVLSHIAYFVRGAWVVKSERVLETSTRLCLARNFLLSSFSSSRRLPSQLITQTLRLPTDARIALLELFAVLDRKEKEWVLRFEDDETFSRCFPNVITQQETVLSALLKESSAALEQTSDEYKFGGGGSGYSSMGAGGSRSGSGRGGGISTLDFDHTQKISQLLDNLFRQFGVCHVDFLLQEIPSGLRTRVGEEGLRQLLDPIAVEIQGRFCRREVGNPDLDDVSIGCVVVCVCFGGGGEKRNRRSGKQERVSTRSTLPAPSYELIFSFLIPYLSKQYRSLVIDLFQSQKTVRKTDVKVAVEGSKLGRLSDQAYMKIMRELAISNRGQWEVKPGFGAN